MCIDLWPGKLLQTIKREQKFYERNILVFNSDHHQFSKYFVLSTEFHVKETSKKKKKKKEKMIR